MELVAAQPMPRLVAAHMLGGGGPLEGARSGAVSMGAGPAATAAAAAHLPVGVGELALQLPGPVDLLVQHPLGFGEGALEAGDQRRFRLRVGSSSTASVPGGTCTAGVRSLAWAGMQVHTTA